MAFEGASLTSTCRCEQSMLEGTWRCAAAPMLLVVACTLLAKAGTRTE